MPNPVAVHPIEHGVILHIGFFLHAHSLVERQSQHLCHAHQQRITSCARGLRGLLDEALALHDVALTEVGPRAAIVETGFNGRRKLAALDQRVEAQMRGVELTGSDLQHRQVGRDGLLVDPRVKAGDLFVG